MTRRTTDTTRRTDTEPTRRYTDSENTGYPAVPYLTTDEDELQTRRETLEEDVLSHRLPTD